MRRTRSVRRPICAIKVSPSTTRVTLAWRLNHAGAASELRAAGRPSCVVAVAVMNPASAAKRSRPNFRKLTPVHLARSHVSDEPTRGRRRPAPSPASLVEPSPQRHRNTMTSQGTPHGRFQRAIHARHLQNAEMAAREMGGLSLADALRLCELLANTDPARCERAALRWLQRFIDERLPPLAEVALAASALAELRHGRRNVGVETLKLILHR
jgi:hypothetical protein